MKDFFRSLRARLVLLLLLVFVPAAVMVAVTHHQQRGFVTAEMKKLSVALPVWYSARRMP